MTEQDPHTPTAAGPEPAPEELGSHAPGDTAASGAAAAQPADAGATAWTPPAAAPSTLDERPELLVGAAFAGGVVAAMLFKRLLGGRD